MSVRFKSNQIFMHWLILLLVVGTFSAIEIRGFFPKESVIRFWLGQTHFSLGVLVFIATLVRIVINFKNPAPPITPAPPQWQLRTAHLVEKILNIIFLLLPILGVLMLTLFASHWYFFGIPMPALNVVHLNMAKMVKNWHVIIANSAYFIIGLHASAALFHHYIQKDDTLLRMMPAKQKSDKS